MRKWLLLILGPAILLVIAVPAGVIYYAACTESGAQFIARHVPRSIYGTRLEIQNVHGTLVRGLTVGRVELEHERVHLRFEGIAGHVALAPILWQTLHVEDVTVHSAFVQVRRLTHPSPHSTPHFLPPGFIIRVDHAHVDGAALIVQNGRRFDGTDVDASGVVRHSTLRLYETNFAMNATLVNGSATLRAADPLQLDADARVSIRFPGQPAWIIGASGRGDLGLLALTGRFSAPFQADFTGRAQDLTGNWHWSGNAKLQTLDLRAWGAGDVLGQISGDLALKGDAGGFAAHGLLTPPGLRAGAFETLFEGAYADRVITARRIEITHRSSGAHVSGDGSIGIVSDGPRLDLHGSWHDFRWPLLGAAAPLRSREGAYMLEGTWPYRLRATGTLAIRDLEPVPIEVEGKLAKTHLTLDSVEVGAFDGQATLSGDVAWAPQESWALTGHANDVNSGRWREDLPGKLNFEFAASGVGFGQGADFACEIGQLSGRFRGAAASGGGKFARQHGAWEFERLRVVLGRTNLALDGRIAQEMDLRFAVDAEDLSLLGDGSEGHLRAQGTLRGTLADPAIVATAHGTGLVHAGMSLASVDASIDFDARGARPSKVDIRARNFAFQDRTLTDAAFTLDGTAADHVAHLSARARGLELEGHASGAFAHGAWQGQLRGLNVMGTESLNLELETPVAMVVSGDEMRVDWFCLRGEPARVCADGDWTRAKWSAAINANDLPMSTLTSGLTPAVDYHGQLTVNARAFGAGMGSIQGNLRADLVDAAITHKVASGRTERITLGTGLVTVTATQSAIDAQVSLDAGETGTIMGKLNAQREIHLIEVDFAVRDLQHAIHYRRAERSAKVEVCREVACDLVDFRNVQRDQPELRRLRV